MFAFANAVTTAVCNYLRAKYPNSTAVVISNLVILLAVNVALVIFSLSVYYPNFLYSNAEKKKKQLFDNYLLKLLQRLVPARNEIINKESIISRIINITQVNGWVRSDHEENNGYVAIDFFDKETRLSQRVFLKRYIAYRLDSKRDYGVYERLEKSIAYLESIRLFKNYDVIYSTILKILKIQVFVKFNDLFTTELSGQTTDDQLGILASITNIGELIKHLHDKKDAHQGFIQLVEGDVIDCLLIIMGDVNKLKLIRNLLDIIEKAGIDVPIDYQDPSASYLMQFYTLLYESHECTADIYKIADENLSKLTAKQKNKLIDHARRLFATSSEPDESNYKVFLATVTNYKQLTDVVGLETEPPKTTLKPQRKFIVQKGPLGFRKLNRHNNTFFRNKNDSSSEEEIDYQNDAKNHDIAKHWQNEKYQLQSHDIKFCAEYLFKDVKNCHFMPAQQGYKKIESVDLVKSLEETATPLLNKSQDVVSIFNKDANHWVCYKLCARDKILYVVYKDSYGRVYDDIFKNAIKKVFSKIYTIRFVYADSQEQPFKDGVNCGIYAVRNAIVLANLDCSNISNQEELALSKIPTMSGKAEFFQLSDEKVIAERGSFANFYSSQIEQFENVVKEAAEKTRVHEEQYARPIEDKLARVPFFKNLLANVLKHSMLSIDCRFNPDDGVTTLNFNLKGILIFHADTFVKFFQNFSIESIVESEPKGDCVHLKISLEHAKLLNNELNDESINQLATMFSHPVTSQQHR